MPLDWAVHHHHNIYSNHTKSPVKSANALESGPNDKKAECTESLGSSPKALFCERQLHFQNGRGQRTGTLTLQCYAKESKVDLSEASENKPLPASWRPSGETTLATVPRTLMAKARRLDGAVIEWVKRNVTNPYPWMVEPDGVIEASAVEHLRGEDLAENQRVVSVEIC